MQELQAEIARCQALVASKAGLMKIILQQDIAAGQAALQEGNPENMARATVNLKRYGGNLGPQGWPVESPLPVAAPSEATAASNDSPAP